MKNEPGIFKSAIGVFIAVVVLCTVANTPVFADFSSNSADDLKLLIRKANAGDTSAQTALGKRYLEGKGVVKNTDQAKKWWLRAAARNNAQAMNNLGALYENGHGVSKDLTAAVSWYKKAALKGNPTAQNNLGILYETGQGVTRNYSESFYWYTKAAESGNADAQSNLASLYANGQGIKPDIAKALAWYQKAAEQGHVYAQYALAMLIDQHNPVNNADGLRWLVASSDATFDQAQNELGVRYLNGTGGASKDPVKAQTLFKAAAEQGNDVALYNLALTYERGVTGNADIPLAVTTYRAAAEKGNLGAIMRLAAIYEHGLDSQIAPDYKEALAWYERAAEGYVSAAVFKAGVMYLMGKGTAMDEAKGKQYLEKAAGLGNVDAMLMLAKIYQEGNGLTAKDMEHAVIWYQKAAERNNPLAANSLGFLYARDAKNHDEYVEAVKWYRKAVELNYPVAYFNLAYHYHYGLGVEKNLDEALRLYTLASKNSDGYENLKVKAEEGIVQVTESLKVTSGATK